MVHVEWEHWLEGNDLVALITKSANKCHERTIGALCHKHLLHWVDLTAKLWTVNLGNLVDKSWDTKSASILVMASLHCSVHIFDQKVRWHEVRGAFSKR